jgi:hypothetical protein
LTISSKSRSFVESNRLIFLSLNIRHSTSSSFSQFDAFRMNSLVISMVSFSSLLILALLIALKSKISPSSDSWVGFPLVNFQSEHHITFCILLLQLCFEQKSILVPFSKKLTISSKIFIFLSTAFPLSIRLSDFALAVFGRSSFFFAFGSSSYSNARFFDWV